jgi:tetratricopeptide (TPR) repeat protein
MDYGIDMEKPGKQKKRVLRPLLWWFLLVLVLYGIHTHQCLMEKTRLVFTVTMEGQPRYDAVATFDGKPATSGQKIPLGNHTFSVTLAKGDPFTTNLFVWYGEHNLGEIALKRTLGDLIVTTTPSAQRLTISGPEWSVTLRNSSGTNTIVPTDAYEVEADFLHSNEKQQVLVTASYSNPLNIAPRFGSVELGCNQPDATYQFQDANGQTLSSGLLPATITELPPGSYSIFATHHGNQHQSSAFVNAYATNTVPMNFDYGAASFDTTPSGAAVTDSNGRRWGETPLTLAELAVGTWNFTVQRSGYAPIQMALEVTANQTNIINTNLVSFDYINGMDEARQYLAVTNLYLAKAAVERAIQASPSDPTAIALQQKIALLSTIQTAETWGAQGNYTNAINLLQTVLKQEPDNDRATELVADYTNREQQRLEAIRQREAELAEQERQRHERELAEQQAQQRIQELSEAFNEANTPYENASQFSNHELVSARAVTDVGTAISGALSGQNPPFENVQLNWIYPHLFMLKARQRVGIGYRDCLILGSQVRDKETRIQFKVFEYEHPPELNLLGGLLHLSTAITLTSQDPQVAADQAAKFQQRIKDGINLMTALIQGAAGQ